MSNDLDEMLNQGPTLTFEPFSQPEAPEVPTVSEATQKVPELVLTPEEQKMVNDFASQIDITNTQMVLQYGAGSQKKIADFSESALSNVRTKDMGEIGQMLAGVVAELKEFNNEEEEKGFLGFFKKGSNKLENLKIKYDKAEGNINKICRVMEDHQVTLLKDAAMLDKMYELNLNYFKLLAKAEQSGLPEDTQAANDFASMCERFEKKIYDLELTRTISMQMAPQIRLIQSNDTAMSEKIQSTLVNTIPLWKSQMVIAIGLSHSTEAAKAQREVTDMTNALLKKNAETLKIATIETARETQRGIVDIETLTATNQTLISTLDEVMKIQEDGRAKRRTAEQELVRIEDEMRQKLLSVSQASRQM